METISKILAVIRQRLASLEVQSTSPDVKARQDELRALQEYIVDLMLRQSKHH